MYTEILPYLPFQENDLAYCMNEWTNDLKEILNSEEMCESG